MVILPDTSAWVQFLRGTGHATHRRIAEAASRGDELLMTEPVAMELLGGGSSTEVARLRSEILALPLLSVGGLATYESAAAIYRRCRSAGKTVRSHVDCLIAAVAIREDVPVLHHDRDFDVIAELSDLRTVASGT